MEFWNNFVTQKEITFNVLRQTKQINKSKKEQTETITISDQENKEFTTDAEVQFLGRFNFGESF